MADLNGTKFGTISALVMKERHKQENRKKEGAFKYTLSDEAMDNFERLTCIEEEVGEIARAILVESGLATDTLGNHTADDEIIQVLALCFAWLESHTVEHLMTANEN